MDIISGIKIGVCAWNIFSTIAPKLTSVMTEFANRLQELSAKYPSLEGFAKIVSKAADFMGDVLYALGIESDRADVMGVKMSQPDTKGIEEFKSAEDYISYLKNEVELDNAKFDKMSPEEKAVYTIGGLAVQTEAVKEKLGIELSADAIELIGRIADSGKCDINAKDIIAFAESMKKDGITNMDDVCDCLKGTGNSDRLKTGESMLNALETLHPGEGNDIIDDLETVARS